MENQNPYKTQITSSHRGRWKGLINWKCVGRVLGKHEHSTVPPGLVTAEVFPPVGPSGIRKGCDYRDLGGLSLVKKTTLRRTHPSLWRDTVCLPWGVSWKINTQISFPFLTLISVKAPIGQTQPEAKTQSLLASYMVQEQSGRGWRVI